MLRVLIAEDEPLLAFALRGALEKRHCEVVGVAANGAEAVALCRQLHPDVVLMDIRMPEMTGIEATRKIMQEAPTCIVVLTASDKAPHLKQAEEAGAMAYLLKPVSSDQILPTIEKARIRFAARGQAEKAS
jgi:AmiR/NasT family two-component response regulator